MKIFLIPRARKGTIFPAMHNEITIANAIQYYLSNVELLLHVHFTPLSGSQERPSGKVTVKHAATSWSHVDDRKDTGQVVTTMQWCAVWCIYLYTPTSPATIYVVQHHSWMLHQHGSDTPLGWNVALPLA